MRYFFITLLICCSSIITGRTNTVNSKISSVLIFCGHPGNSANEAKFQSKIETVKRTLIQQYHFDTKALHIYFNQGAYSFLPCTKNDVITAIESMNKLTQKGNNCLILFLGHANSTAKDINYNLPGPDLSIKNLARHIRSENTKGKLGIIWAIESGQRAVKLLGDKNLIVLAASETEDRDNEPVLNEVIDKLFDKSLVDLNKDGKVSFSEMHMVAKNEVKQWYQDKNLIQLEKIILDGDGNGSGTAAPSPIDNKGAEKITLHY